MKLTDSGELIMLAHMGNREEEEDADLMFAAGGARVRCRELRDAWIHYMKTWVSQGSDDADARKAFGQARLSRAAKARRWIHNQRGEWNRAQPDDKLGKDSLRRRADERARKAWHDSCQAAGVNPYEVTGTSSYWRDVVVPGLHKVRKDADCQRNVTVISAVEVCAKGYPDRVRGIIQGGTPNPRIVTLVERRRQTFRSHQFKMRLAVWQNWTSDERWKMLVVFGDSFKNIQGHWEIQEIPPQFVTTQPNHNK
jgi:hypothetical protein